MTDIQNAILPSLTTGLVSGLGSQLVLGADGSFQKPLPGGFTLSEPIAYGLLGGISKFTNLMIQDQVIPFFSDDGSLMGIAGLAAPVLTGLVFVGFESLSVGQMPPLQYAGQIFALGFGADLVGSYVHDNLMQMQTQ